VLGQLSIDDAGALPSDHEEDQGVITERYLRHELVAGWQQKRLEDASVIVIGVGALGNSVAQTLALAGVGRLVLCDPDVVSESNLSRAPLFRPADVGRPKVEAARDRLRELAPDVVVDARRARLVSGVGLSELRDADLVLGCLDSRAARLDLAGRCSLVDATLIDGGTGDWSGEVRAYMDRDGPCYGCALSPGQRAEIDGPRSCLDPVPLTPVGASQPVSGLVGCWMALLAVRALSGLEVATGTIVVDGLAGTASHVALERAEDCPWHRRLDRPQVFELGPDPLVGQLRASLPEGASLLAWTPVQTRARCPRGHVDAPTWGIPRDGVCRVCGRHLRVQTTLSLAEAPAELRMSELGVAPNEILAVQHGAEFFYVELRS
jgi:molybdopterin/thiamine biosynthesis adenylyltransferase